MSNQQYNNEKVFEILLEYLFSKKTKELTALSFDNLYHDMVDYTAKKYPRISIPAVSQLRKYIIENLKKENLYYDGERLTSEVVCRFKTIYYNTEVTESYLHHSCNISIYDKPPIICTVKLPPSEIFDKISDGNSKYEGKSRTWRHINLIQEMCEKIKENNPSLILAVIPGLNRMAYLNNKGHISKKVENLNILCDTLCVFVKNTPDGQKLVEDMQKNKKRL